MHTLDESVRRDNGILDECEITEKKKSSQILRQIKWFKGLETILQYF